MNYFSNKLRRIMMQRNLSQRDISQMANVSQVAISKWLSGISTPKISFIERLANALNISVGELIGDFGGNAQLTEDDKRWLALSPKHKKFLLKVLDAMQESEE